MSDEPISTNELPVDIFFGCFIFLSIINISLPPLESAFFKTKLFLNLRLNFFKSLKFFITFHFANEIFFFSKFLKRFNLFEIIFI